MPNKEIDINRALIEKSIRGDSKAQYDLYQLYANTMYFTCYHMMHNKEEAEDMLQDSFSEAFMNLHRFKYESTFGTWLKRIVVNKCINEIKRKKTDLYFSDAIEDYESHQEDDTEITLSIDNVKKAMKQLPDGSRAIFQLYLLEGYDHREIAEILQVSESNSKSQYMVARRKIKEILKDQFNETR